MAWEVEVTDEFRAWFNSLTDDQRVAVVGRVDMLEAKGPLLRRPAAGEIKGSRHDPQVKELLCSQDGALRILFIFDPRRTAILLLGGDKTGEWNAWYDRAIPQADDLYDTYLDELRAEGEI